MNIAIIEASVRPNRIGDRITKWVQAAAQARPEFATELIDLAEYNLPFFNETASPRYNPRRQAAPAVQRLLDRLAAADGYIIVSPEYNHAIPATLKNALDYTDFQIAKKPFAIVSYGSVGGARAAEMLKPILIESKAAVVPEAVAIVNPTAVIDESGHLTAAAGAGLERALATTLTELAWWTKTLAAGRQRLTK